MNRFTEWFLRTVPPPFTLATIIGVSTARDTRLVLFGDVQHGYVYASRYSFKGANFDQKPAKKGCIVFKGKTPHVEKSQFTGKGQIGTVYNNSSDAGDDHANAT